jgi:RimJ/RimL family protein N-acetyltransferase
MSSFTSAPDLLTDRLRLRSPRIEDFDAMARMWGDESTMRFISGVPSTPSESWSRLLRYIGHWQALGFGYWVVEDRAAPAFLGEVGLADYRREMTPSIDGMPEIGWVLTPEARGRGIATEAAQAAIGWADAHLSAARSCCIFDPAHAASRRVAQKLGYADAFTATFKERPTLVMTRPRAQ